MALLLQLVLQSLALVKQTGMQVKLVSPFAWPPDVQSAFGRNWDSHMDLKCKDRRAMAVMNGKIVTLGLDLDPGLGVSGMMVFGQVHRRPRTRSPRRSSHRCPVAEDAFFYRRDRGRGIGGEIEVQSSGK